jgi:SDR family mycofactocin-dependent oxidoreductase
MGRVSGKVALVTGAARGQGRAHAVKLADEGASIVALDICRQIPQITIPMASRADLDETVRAVTERGARIIPFEADVRDQEAIDAAVDAAYAEFGAIDIVVANAGVTRYTPANQISEDEFREILDVNLIGVWRTCKSVATRVIEARASASMILTSSIGGLKAGANLAHYSASKHGLIGLMRSLAKEYAPASIRVNAICPTNVNTPMLMAADTLRLFVPDEAEPSLEEFTEVARRRHVLDVPWVEPEDIANAALFLACDEARYITGVALPVDAGALLL